MNAGVKKLFVRKRVMLSVMLVVLAAAIYVNWKYAGANGGLNVASKTSSKNGSAEYVATSNVKIDNEYFTSAKADREKAYADALADFADIENSAKASEDEKALAYKAHIAMVERQEKQTNIETLVKAKGFADCVTVINDDNVTVVVSSEELSNSEMLQIQDIVSDNCKVELKNIKIINIK